MSCSTTGKPATIRNEVMPSRGPVHRRDRDRIEAVRDLVVRYRKACIETSADAIDRGGGRYAAAAAGEVPKLFREARHSGHPFSRIKSSSRCSFAFRILAADIPISASLFAGTVTIENSRSSCSRKSAAPVRAGIIFGGSRVEEAAGCWPATNRRQRAGAVLPPGFQASRLVRRAAPALGCSPTHDQTYKARFSA